MKKTYEQEQREKRIDSIQKESSVVDWLTDGLELANEKDYKLVIDPISKKCTLYSTNPNAHIDGADLIGGIVLALAELEDLAQHGCVILYKQNDAPVTLCNTKLQNCSSQFSIEEETLYKYINYHIVATEKLDQYKSHGYMYLDNYIASENLKTAKDTLVTTNKALYCAIVTMIISIVSTILSICLR